MVTRRRIGQPADGPKGCQPGGNCPTACAALRPWPQRHKRSISLPPDLAKDIERAAESEGKTVSKWIAQTAAHRLKLEAGRRAIAAWELDHGALTASELA
jgi:hypothetical protein